jgi:hypothetical protein
MATKTRRIASVRYPKQPCHFCKEVQAGNICYIAQSGHKVEAVTLCPEHRFLWLKHLIATSGYKVLPTTGNNIVTRWRGFYS